MSDGSRATRGLSRRSCPGLIAACLVLTGAGAVVGNTLNPSDPAGSSTSEASSTKTGPAASKAASTPENDSLVMPDLVGKPLSAADALRRRPRIRFVDRRGSVTILAQAPKPGSRLTGETTPTLTAAGSLTRQDAAALLGVKDGSLRITGKLRVSLPPHCARLQMNISSANARHSLRIRSSRGGPETRRTVTASVTRLTVALDNAEWIELESDDGSVFTLNVRNSELTKAP